MNRLLLLSCSRRKHADSGLLPGIERYDGPAFRVLRRFLRRPSTDTLDSFVLSAKFGLIPSNQPITNYDQQMTPKRTQELQSEVSAAFSAVVAAKTYDALCICMGRTYLAALEGYDRFIVPGIAVTVATGTIGKMLASLHDWLYQDVAIHNADALPPDPAGAEQRAAQLRGVTITATAEQVLAIARQALVAGRGDPGRYQSWYVEVDGQRVSVKWLVSQVTGLPLGSFHSSEARHLLRKRGIKVHSVH